MAVVLVFLVHQICAYPVSSRERVTDLQRALASLLVRAQLREEAEQQMIDDCPDELWCEGLCQDRNKIARAQNPCLVIQAQAQKVYAQNERLLGEEHSKLDLGPLQEPNIQQSRMEGEMQQSRMEGEMQQSRMEGEMQQSRMEGETQQSREESEIQQSRKALAHLLALIQAKY